MMEVEGQSARSARWRTTPRGARSRTPCLGWAAASAHGVPVKLLGIVTLPPLASRKAQWGFVAGDIHGYAMWTLHCLVGLHPAAALYHHFVRHDDVLRRML